MNIHESAEDYLESILKIKEQKGNVRSIDIAAELGFSKPSVSIAMKRLRENGYITMDDSNLIELTEMGRKVATKIYTREKELTLFLENLGVGTENARKDACKMEHDISEETFMKIVEFNQKV
ncbi:MAG: metal-dependent transcriptional regulator [Lachnospiraceae bacterium]|nr:metal-dependent transcriptional regulator [Lachnospiraceae bacterium]MBR1914522.1 metal-dependent transcriptional regulator [Lachnospiraceae bacterium]